MRWSAFIVRTLVILAILTAAAWSTEQRARTYEGEHVGGSTREGAPFAYRVHRVDSSEDGRSSTRFDRTAFAANLGVLASIALASAAHWSRATGSREPHTPMRLPLGAEPLPPGATVRNEPRLRRLAVRGVVAVVVTLAGALLGLGVGLGLLGWWYGARSCSRYAMLGRAPTWPAVVARELGPPVALTSLLALLGVLLGWGVQ